MRWTTTFAITMTTKTTTKTAETTTKTTVIIQQQRSIDTPTTTTTDDTVASGFQTFSPRDDLKGQIDVKDHPWDVKMLNAGMTWEVMKSAI